MSDGSNAAKGLPGYKKTMSQPYLTELWNAAPAAPPDAGLPWTVGGYDNNPLISDPPNQPPPAPDRMLRGLSTCGSCGGTFGFNGVTDAQVCPQCADAQRITGGLTAPGTPWF